MKNHVISNISERIVPASDFGVVLAKFKLHFATQLLHQPSSHDLHQFNPPTQFDTATVQGTVAKHRTKRTSVPRYLREAHGLQSIFQEPMVIGSGLGTPLIPRMNRINNHLGAFLNAITLALWRETGGEFQGRWLVGTIQRRGLTVSLLGKRL